MSNASTTYRELMAMDRADLVREIRGQKLIVSKLHMGIVMKTEKDTAKYRRERRALARMNTALNAMMKAAPAAPTSEKTEKAPLKKTTKKAKVSAPKKS